MTLRIVLRAGIGLVLCTASLLLATCSGSPTVPPIDVREEIIFSLASTFHVDPGQIHIVGWEEVTWPDACLGIPMRDLCPSEAHPGYRLLVDIREDRHEFHLSAHDPLALSLAAAPQEGITAPYLIWERQRDRCLSLHLDDNGQGAFGYCDGPHLAVPMRRDRQAEWQALRERFAPFTYERTPDLLVFEGYGHEEAPEAWRRAVNAWAGLIRPEMEAGRSGAAWGTAFVWQRQHTKMPDTCDVLTVVTYGRAFATRLPCSGGQATYVGDGWLQTVEWEPFDRWLYHYGPTEYTRGPATLHFYGLGNADMPPDEVSRLTRWAETLFDRLGAVR